MLYEDNAAQSDISIYEYDVRLSYRMSHHLYCRLQEQYACNFMAFPYADKRGEEPKDVAISTEYPKLSALTTSLPLSTILNSQSIGAENDQVVISSEPGEFVCNYIYYKSLLHQKSKGSPLNSLLIYVPPSDPQATDHQATDHQATVVKIVKQLITSVCKACFQ